MWKVPPDVRVCGQTGRPGVFLAAFRAGGMPDYLGYVTLSATDNPWRPKPVFIACEVKECNTETMPASRLSRLQREFLSDLPDGTAYVGILWRDGTFEMFPFVNKGSYKKGNGTR